MQTTDAIKTKEDVEAIGKWLYDNTSPKFFAAYVIGISTGLRMTELVSLKSDSGMSQEGYEYLFPSNCGGHISADTFRKVLKKAAKKCGVPGNMGTHTLRKTFGWFHFMKNHDLALLQHIFGHGSEEITTRYIGLISE